MTRALVLLLALATAAHADPPAKRKRAPDKFTKAAGETFNQALAADQANELDVALGLYQKAYAISPHPSTAYNIADVQRRMNRLVDAIESYETYLVLAPSAPDRAEVEALIGALARTPGWLFLYTRPPSDPEALDLAAAYVLVDGEIVRKPGALAAPKVVKNRDPVIELQLPPGEHVIDIVTALTHDAQTCKVLPGGQTHCEVRAAPRIDGTAVVSAVDRDFRVYADRDDKSLVQTRVELPAGKQRLRLQDRRYECGPVALDVRGGNAIAYVFVASAERDYVKRCRTYRLKTHALTFAP